MKFLLIICLFARIAGSQKVFFDEPHIQTTDGHLYIYGAESKNVSFEISPKGYLNVNGENLYKIVKEAKQASLSILSLKYSTLTKLEEDVKFVSLSIDQMAQRLNVCETLINNLQGGSASAGLPFQFQMKINKLERRVKTILRNLAKRECQKDPCLNGGTCLDKYLDYECRCLEGWEGKSCERDVNECAKFAGSDLGCQNGASCINKPGTYECICASGWYGLHCTRRSNDCSSGPAGELCGHGTCVTQTSGPKGYTCICEQGWKTDGVNPACVVDVDECLTFPCSRNPLVTCHNTPGSFFCGPCPQGYSGNGFSCVDINECLVENGGCSVQPLVQCINTIGSSKCGSCPPGYLGDGRTCNFVGKCQVDNGGCNANARCQEVGTSIQCQCLPGYTGSGVGPSGCELLSGQAARNPCIPNPCKNQGRCYGTPNNNFTCSCRPGFTGPTCNRVRNPCSINPCQNGGTCVAKRDSFICRCTPVYTGKYCQKTRQSCGGFLNSDDGELRFPPANSSSTRYDHNLNCAWIIIVNSTLVINVTFDYFDLESAPECQFDWMQIHDGKSAGDHIIGKFCGDQLPNNGTIISTTNYMYMWFKSDGSQSKNGFKLKWRAVSPVCGGPVNASIHGTIKSPGSPGKYPPNRDCLWLVSAPLGKRITFTFFEIFIETHQNCSYDFLEFHEGLTLDSPVLARYCNTTIPPPLVTPGNTALVYFHSDQYQSDRGFQIAFHPTPGYPGCGGIFTNRRGVITPPMEDGDYIRNMDCSWLIRMPGNLRIKIEFTKFKLEDGHNCNTDFLEIREGSDITSPLIGRYCGFTVPPPILSNGNALFVRFFSDNTIQSTGFRLVYSSVCMQQYYGESGVIKSPGYPENYRSQEVCTFLWQSNPGKVVQLEFQDFDFEAVSQCFYDYLEIHDGYDERSPLIKRYCGTDRPPRIVSSHNYLWMKMVTDKDVEHRGFYANFTTIDVSCGGIYTQSMGEIHSPSDSGSYPPNHTCRWVIIAQPGDIIELTFTSFKLEFHARCEFDYVEVYDNSSLAQDGGELVGRFCGETVPPLLTSTDSIMTIVFRSDSSLSMEGFSAKFKFINTSTACGGNYFTKVGVIRSPNYPKRYPNDKTCVWVIKVPYGNKITLKVDSFSLEDNTRNSNQCLFDFLEIRDGGYDSSPLIGRYCGVKIPKRILSQSNVMYLKFKSDKNFPSSGFSIHWDGTLTGCGGTLSAFSGSIISPNYPEPYGANSLCIYKINVALGSKILLGIMDLDLEYSGSCETDYIELIDGPDLSGKSLGRFCSSTNHPPSVTSITNQMTIKFVSDVRDSGKGFYLKYRAECNVNMTGHRGVIESPNFPDPFPGDTSCTWIIKAPAGNKINISFSDFNFYSPCADDYLEFKEGENDGRTTNTIGKYCKDKKPTLIASSLEWVHVHLKIGPYSVQGNFRLEWVVNGCGGTFSKPQGTFTSPNYPKTYPPFTLCEYYISVNPSYGINLYISNINFDIQTIMEVRGGPDATSPLLATVLGKPNQPVKIQTSGSKMYLRFATASDLGGTGFKANYTTEPTKCGGHQISLSGKITSRNYPKNYNPMDNCLWLIQVDANHRVNLTFQDFDLASDPFCNGTYVEVLDGPSESSPSILKHCGNTMPTPNSLISTTNYLTVRMRTDQGFPAKGFMASYRAACGATIVVHEPGVITPSFYYHDTVPEAPINCSWTLISGEPDGHITLTVTYSGVTGPYYKTSLSVYDGIDQNATLIGSYSDSKSYLPVVSRGNAMHLVFSDVIYRLQNHFWATYSSSSSACGGTLSGETGSFASPNYPGSYPPNAECVWILHTAPGNRIQVNFKEIDLGLTDNCNEEYVELREKGPTGKLMGIYCGSTPPGNLTANDKIWVKFRSSKTGSGKKGFLVDYSLVYNIELNGTSGEIANPFYPRTDAYHTESISWRITVDFGNLVRITFKELSLDDFYESKCTSSLKVFDGFDDTAPELASACGLNKPDPVTSSSNVAYIVFSQVPDLFGSLFLLQWEQVSRWSSLDDSTTSSSSGCGERLDFSSIKNESILITNPGYPEPNRTHLDCEWIIQSPDDQHLVLTVNSLSLNNYGVCTYSYVAIHTMTTDGDWKEVKKLCQGNETDTEVTTSNFMKITVVTGYDERFLFSLSVRTECGNSIKKPNGAINMFARNSTRYWSNYHLYCTWDITVSSGKNIRVVFTEFDFLPQGDGCSETYVLLKNGGSDDSPLLGKGTYCKFPGIIPLTTSNKLFIKVKALYSGTTFRMKFEEVSPQCGNRVILNENFNVTIISSPNYPNIPPSKIECIWTFLTTGGHRLQIDFLERFDLAETESCDEEYVQVRDGGTELSDEMGTFCTDKPSTQKSSGNMLFVKYFTNATNPRNGFKAQVSLARCGGVIRSSSGVLTSPYYPNSYAYDMECRWEIEVDVGFKLTVSFEDLDLPIGKTRTTRELSYSPLFLKIHPPRRKPYRQQRIWATDFLKNQTNCSSTASIAIGEPAPQEPATPTSLKLLNSDIFQLVKSIRRAKRNIMLQYICNNEPVSPIKASANKVIIVFQSGPNNHNLDHSPRGFKLNFSSVDRGCRHVLDTPSGVITSPGYPNKPRNYYYCIWQIKVPKGRRVTLKVEDFDMTPSALGEQAMLFNDLWHHSRIALLSGASKVETYYKSSTNMMSISYWSNTLSGSGHRGFKFTYTSDEPQICGGDLTENEGVISSPVNVSTFYCEWNIKRKKLDNETVAIYIKDAVIGNRTGICAMGYGTNLVISGKGVSSFYTELCGNISSRIIRHPFPDTEITASHNLRFGAVNFTISYKIFACGGVIFGPEATIISPFYPNSYPVEVDCAWLISFPPGQNIKLTFQDFNLQPSCSDYLTIKNGPSPKSPLIGQYCGTSLSNPAPVISEGSSLFLEFHSGSSSQGKGFKLFAETSIFACGGAVHSLGYELMSPNFPSEYENNQECEWEIKSTEGTHIGLVFVDRFHIESSENCQNDFVKVFDYVRDEWKLLKTLCGRELPSAVNSTSNKMKVLFRSNNAVVSDGFKAKWYQNCGGTYWNTQYGRIVSPGYPEYKSNLNCHYIIDSGGDNIFLNFTYFNLEQPFSGSCKYDFVKIYEEKWDSKFELVGEYCGNTPPTPRYLKSKVKIEFVSDAYNNYGGFIINFNTSKCGGMVNESSVIGYFYNTFDLEHSPKGDCIWEIVAPPEKIIALRLEKLNLAFSDHCSYPYVEVSEERKNETKLLAHLCGVLSPREVVVKSTGNKMKVKLKKTPLEDEGFTALVVFTYGKTAGCGGEVSLSDNPVTIQSPDVNTDGFYEEYLDCTWVIRTKPFHQIVAEFRSIDVHDCQKIPGANSTDTCACDYVRLLDGTEYVSEVLLHTCGSTIPDSVTSSGSEMSLKFSTDGTYNGRGFNIKFSTKLSQCGNELLTPMESVQTLTSPFYPENYPEGLRCKWIIRDISDSLRRALHVHVVEWDIVESENCDNDFLYLEDTEMRRSLYEVSNYEYNRNGTSDSMEIIRGKQGYIYFYDRSRPLGKTKICGKGKTLDFYSGGDEVTVGFTSTSSTTKKGFKLEYSIAGCSRNYSTEYGQIKNQHFENHTHCFIVIEAPTPNHTISLYFTSFYLKQDFLESDCPHSYMEIRDGANGKAPLLGKFCGYIIPNTVYSTGQYLWLHYYVQLEGSGNDYQTLDMTFMTTDQGKGCGGRFHGVIGTFTSPGYPSNTRKNSVCRWDITAPKGLELTFHFNGFDIGPSNTCNSDYIEFYDVITETNTEVLRSRFCGRDTPAEIRTPRAVAIKYTSSVHNGGTGWQLEYKAVPPGLQIL